MFHDNFLSQVLIVMMVFTFPPLFLLPEGWKNTLNLVELGKTLTVTKGRKGFEGSRLGSI